ncbi:DUF6978 family protein [uncultured Lactobacillus sp.]|uniref:DUF6978 family protein n=1 Tax=uncultured Lactobacillus sp. TaxID=153152 RepID=UPI00258C3D26|nr:hypothetical protein [uncultured Lactobacillus sp.]
MEDIDTTKLTKEDVHKLIDEIKKFANQVSISIPLVGKVKLDKEVIGESTQIAYRFHIYRGNIKVKYSLHLRFSDSNIHLVRLCVNGTRHKNYDGTEVGRNHIHIYKYLSSDDEVVDYAYDLNDFPFDAKDELTDAVTKFSKYVNLKS